MQEQPFRTSRCLSSPSLRPSVSKLYLPPTHAGSKEHKNISIGCYLFSIIEQMTSAGDADVAEFKQVFVIKLS